MAFSHTKTDPFKAIIIPHGFEPNYTLGFVKGLKANGVKFVVISSDTDHQRLCQSGIRSVNLRGSQIPERSSLRKGMTLFLYYLKLIYFLLKNRNKVVHFSGIFRNELVVVEGWLLCFCFRLLSSRFIYTVHNVLPHNKGNSRFFRCIYKVIYKFPNLFLVHTQLAKRMLKEQFSVPDNKITVISIGLNEEMPMTVLTKEEAKKKLGLLEEEKAILFFGKADEYKGLDLLIQAFERLSLDRLKLLIASWFPSKAYREKILSLIACSSKRKDILLVEGFIPNEEVEVYCKGGEVLALPYRNIYQSGVIFLCFRFGLPIVATDVGSVREFVTDEVGIIAETNDVSALASAFKRFFEQREKFDSEVIKTLGLKYRWEEVCHPLACLYERKLVAEKNQN